MKWIPGQSLVARTCSEIWEALPLTMLDHPWRQARSLSSSIRGGRRAASAKPGFEDHRVAHEGRGHGARCWRSP